MSQSPLEHFVSHVRGIVSPIVASPARKRIMRDELLGHLFESYEQALDRTGDEEHAIELAKQLLGAADALRSQLQASVPLVERALFACFNCEETVMSRFLWAVAVVALAIAMNVRFGLRDEVHLASIALICALCVHHLLQPTNLASRFLGRRWPWLVGSAATLCGTMIILPAMANYGHAGGFMLRSIEFMALGSLIVLCGLGFIARASRKRSAQSA